MGRRQLARTEAHHVIAGLLARFDIEMTIIRVPGSGKILTAFPAIE